jgi:hypothetical protein
MQILYCVYCMEVKFSIFTKTRALPNKIPLVQSWCMPANGKANFQTYKGVPADGKISTKNAMKKASEFRKVGRYVGNITIVQ